MQAVYERSGAEGGGIWNPWRGGEGGSALVQRRDPSNGRLVMYESEEGRGREREIE